MNSMEWNFLFRIDHLNITGEERDLKGLVFTEKDQTPTLEQIKDFLANCGYDVDIKDPDQMLFANEDPEDPIEIKIIQLGSKDEDFTQDLALKLLAEQFRKKDPFIG